MKKLLFTLMFCSIVPMLVSADNDPCPDSNHPHKIDLGLPSGTRWACCNIDTSAPEAYGGYYAWGELVEKNWYGWSNYSLSSAGSMYDLTAEEDVATVLWGSKWRMPTMDEFRELIKYCTWSWEEYNGVMGARVTGPNGNAIFLPAGAMKDEDYYTAKVGTYGSYWGRTHASSSSYATELVFGTAYYNNNYQIGDFYYEMGPTGTRQTGRLVRAVGTERYIDDNDYTIYITNPSFDDNLYSGWEGTVLSGVGPDNNAEHYNKNYDTFQHLHGLPPGWYTLGLQGFYRKGSYSNDYALWLANDTEHNHALLYASSAAGSYSVPLVPASSAAIPERLGGNTARVGNGLYIPDNMVAAGAWFEAGYYHNYLDVEVGDDGELTIGIKKDVTLSGDWTMIDNWTLFRTDNNPVKMITPDAATFKVSDIRDMSFVASWEYVPGARFYDIVVKELDGTYDNPVFKRSLTATSIEVTGLNPDTYYQFKVRARNGNRNQNSDWSNSLATPVKTEKANTMPAQLSIYGDLSINNSGLLAVNKTYTYKVFVKNTGFDMWRGSFYLREGDELIHEWEDKTILSNISCPLECDYTPLSIGTKSLVLYYKTRGSNTEIPVNYGFTSTNELVVEVNEYGSSYSGILNLEEAIDCPATLEWGNTSPIVVNIKNADRKDWSGFLYLMDNDNPLTIDAATIKAGETYILKLDRWKPTPEEHHTITALFKTEEDIIMQQVNPNIFANPISVEVLNVNVPTTASEAVLTLITKDCAPKVINYYDDVFYHYRIKTKDGVPLKGIRAVFQCTGSSRPGSSVFFTTPSDAEGYAFLYLPAYGDNAIGNRGDDMKFTCTHLVDEQGNNVKFYNANTIDGYFELTIHKGNEFTQVTGFEDVETFEVTIDKGISGEAKFGSLASASAAISFPLTTKFIWKDDKFLTEIVSEAKAEGKGSANLELGKFKGGLGVEYYNGRKESTVYNWKNKQKATKAIIWNWLGSFFFSSSAATSLAIQAFENWFLNRPANYYNEVIEESPKTSTFWGVTPSLKTEFKFDSDVSSLSRSKRFPNLSRAKGFEKYEMTGALEASMKIEPYKETISNVETSYSKSCDLRTKVSMNWSELAGALSPTKMTRWKKRIGTYVEKIGNKYYKILDTNKFWDFKYGVYANFNTKEEETYRDREGNKLKELSNSLEAEIGFNLSSTKLKDYIWPGWMTEENMTLTEGIGKRKISFSASSSFQWKNTSKGEWAEWLQNLTAFPDSKKIVGNIFPLLKNDYLVQAPLTHLGQLLDNTSLESSLQYASANTTRDFAVKDAFKTEFSITDKAGVNLSIPIAQFGPFDISLDCGLQFKFAHYPSVTYYSVADKQFFPVVFRSSTPLMDMMKNFTSWLGNKINSAFTDDDKLELNEEYELASQREDAKVSPESVASFTTDGTKHLINSQAPRIRRKHPMIAKQQQKDICTFTYTINEGSPNFIKETDVSFSHFYPAGSLIGMTEQNDTLFVLSEVCKMDAFQDGDTLKTTQQGKMKLVTTTGADDLTPFGISTDTPLDVYHSDDGEIWQNVGTANQTIMVDKLGYYMIGTSLKNDQAVPEIEATIDEAASVLRLHITDNIGLRTSTLIIMINGMSRSYSIISESDFEVSLTPDDLQHSLTIFATIFDLSGNQGKLFLAYNIDMADNIDDVTAEQEKPEIHLSRSLLNVSHAQPGSAITLFSIKGEIVAKGHADAKGHAHIHTNSLQKGLYIVTLSNGMSKKLFVK